jgi:hypothetical protein
VQHIALGALSLSLLVACGTSGEQAAADTASPPSTPAAAVLTDQVVPPATEVAPPAAVPSTPTDEESLRAAVQGYSDAFLGGISGTAYGYFSVRCQGEVSLSYFTGIVMAAGQV